MPITQCPRCELRFSHVTEMRWHLREDHPSERKVESTPLTIPVQQRDNRATPDPSPDDPSPDDPPPGAPARDSVAPSPPGRRAALWWRRRQRSNRGS